MISLESHKLDYVVKLGFKASNNVDEYEVLLAGLKLAKEMEVQRLVINRDSQLVVS